MSVRERLNAIQCAQNRNGFTLEEFVRLGKSGFFFFLLLLLYIYEFVGHEDLAQLQNRLLYID